MPAKLIDGKAVAEGIRERLAKEMAALALAQWRRRWSKTARQRSELFTSGMTAYLHGHHDEARSTFRRLVRTDPWDAGAWLALGNVHSRQRQPGAASRCYRRGLRVDLGREYTDLARRLLGRPGPRATANEPQSTASGAESAPTGEPAPATLPQQPAQS